MTSASRATDKRRSSRGSRRLCWRWPKPGTRLPCARQSATSSSAASSSDLRSDVRRRVDDRGDGLHRGVHRGAVELAQRQEPGGRRGLQGGTTRDRGAGGQDRRGAGAVVDAGDHDGIDQSGRPGIGELAGVEQVDDGGERNRADQFGDVVARGSRSCRRWSRTATWSTLAELRSNRLCSTTLTSLAGDLKRLY